MRMFLAACIALVITYWFDQHYFYGATSDAVAAMLRDITGHFK
jgi:hypothetical protein